METKVGQKFLRDLVRDKIVSICVFYLMTIVLLALFAPLLTSTYLPSHEQLAGINLPPSEKHWFGTDDIGRDVFSRTIWGARVSLTIGLIVQVITLAIGVTVGVIAGINRGMVDTILMRFTEMMLAFPSLLLALGISIALGKGILTVYIAIAISSWPYVARLIRSQVLLINTQDYIEAAHALGASKVRIAVSHVLPGLLPLIIVIYTIGVAGAILSEAGLSFLGLGVQPPEPSWGRMIADGIDLITTAPWVSIYPGLFIAFTVFSFNILGDFLRDELDVKLSSYS